MLRHQPWLKYTDGFELELQQCEEEGKITTAELRAEHKAILNMADCAEKQEAAKKFYIKTQSLPIKSDWKYNEPNTLNEIKELRPTHIYPNNFNIGDDVLFDRIKGGWFGRCAGCLLGKPVEGWHKDRLHGLLKDTKNYPINYYISSDIDTELIKKYNMSDWAAWINKVSFMPEDDDTNYTVIGLKLLQTYGKNFTSEDVAECWLQNLPILHVCTAERVAYKNMVNGLLPPETASFANPYREWIGAQIRADFFGYIVPANPELGAEYAFRDASISHVKNGIYGEMWVAAMLSTAYMYNANIPDVIKHIILGGLAQIPEKCRLADDIKAILSLYYNGKSFDETMEFIHTKYNEANSHDWCHTNSNAMIVAAALLYGECDFEKTIGYAVMCAFDTDCNGATAGSILGVLLGADALPKKWIDPLCDTIISGVDGFGKVTITSLAEKTMALTRS